MDSSGWQLTIYKGSVDCTVFVILHCGCWKEILLAVLHKMFGVLLTANYNL